MKLVVISFCKDEAETIQEVIKRVPKKISKINDIDIVIIDDGSKDNTAEVARKAGAEVVSESISKGVAFRFREAIDIALEKNADIMVNIDGDLQFDPEDIPKLVQPILENKADFVAADRFTDPRTGEMRRPKNMPLGKYIGNKLGARVTGKLSGRNFKDVTCGFRAYNREALFALNTHGKHTYTQESFQVLSIKNLRIETMPVAVKYFPGRKSRVVTSVFKYTFVSALNILRAYRDFAPLRFFFAVGLTPFVVGILCVGFLGVHYLSAGQFSPYKFVGLTGLYLISLGFFVWGLGIVADMLVRILGNQEKTQEEIKRLRYKK